MQSEEIIVCIGEAIINESYVTRQQEVQVSDL